MPGYTKNPLPYEWEVLRAHCAALALPEDHLPHMDLELEPREAHPYLAKFADEPDDAIITLGGPKHKPNQVIVDSLGEFRSLFTTYNQIVRPKWRLTEKRINRIIHHEAAHTSVARAIGASVQFGMVISPVFTEGMAQTTELGGAWMSPRHDFTKLQFAAVCAAPFFAYRHDPSASDCDIQQIKAIGYKGPREVACKVAADPTLSQLLIRPVCGGWTNAFHSLTDMLYLRKSQ